MYIARKLSLRLGVAFLMALLCPAGPGLAGNENRWALNTAYADVWKPYIEASPLVKHFAEKYLNGRRSSAFEAWLLAIGVDEPVREEIDEVPLPDEVLSIAKGSRRWEEVRQDLLSLKELLVVQKDSLFYQVRSYLLTDDLTKRAQARDYLIAEIGLPAVVLLDGDVGKVVSLRAKALQPIAEASIPDSALVQAGCADLWDSVLQRLDLTPFGIKKIATSTSFLNLPRWPYINQPGADDITFEAVRRSSILSPEQLIEKRKKQYLNRLTQAEVISLYNLVRSASDRLKSILQIYLSNSDSSVILIAREELVDMAGAAAVTKFDDKRNAGK